jgi:signal transduction histidine kinase
LKKESKAQERSQRAVELLGSAIDVKISELTEANRQLKRKVFDLYTIFEISRNFSSVLNYKTLVDTFILTALGQIGASSAALYLLPGGQAEAFGVAIAKGLTAEKDSLTEIPAKGRLASYLTIMAKPMTIHDLKEQFADSPELSALAAFGRGLVIPLILKSELKGILVLGAKISGVGFSPDDIEFLSILANQFVVALENARLYESEKNVLNELRIAQKQLVVTERQAAIGELSAKIAHEVNNPLSIISNYLHMCERNLEHPDEARENLDVAHQELARIAKIVRQLLDFHRPQRAEKAPVQVNKVIDDVLALMQWQLAERKIDVEQRIDDRLPLVMGSPEQLKQVFLNLIINARDVMPDGGKLLVDIAGDTTEIKVRISDSGPGIPDEHLSHIFEPFFTTKDSSWGTGLGLAVCFGIVKDHGGRIVAGNGPLGGAVFQITLPAVPQTKGAAGG